MVEAFKNHWGERVSVFIEELVLQDHFLRTIEVTIRFDFIEENYALITVKIMVVLLSYTLTGSWSLLSKFSGRPIAC